MAAAPELQLVQRSSSREYREPICGADLWQIGLSSFFDSKRVSSMEVTTVALMLSVQAMSVGWSSSLVNLLSVVETDSLAGRYTTAPA